MLILVYCVFIGYKTEATSQGIRFTEIRAEYERLRIAILNREQEERLPGSESTRQTITPHLWPLVEAWTLTYLDETPNVTTPEIEKKLEELDSLGATVLQLVEGEHTTYLISANIVLSSDYPFDYPLSGTFFIVTRALAGHFQVAWRIKDLANTHAVLKDEFGYWSDLCIGCGAGFPLLGHAKGLPSNATGFPRFYIDATEATAAGETPRQISIWEWNGTEAVPLLIQSYRATGNTEHVIVDGEYLKITIKDDFSMEWSCDMCTGAEVIWTLKITPKGIEDLGRVYIDQEIKLLSDLWDRVLHHENTNDLASLQVAEIVRQIIDKWGEVVGQGSRGGIISAINTSRLLCFGPNDNLDEQIFFRIENNDNRLYFSHAFVVENDTQRCWELNDQEIAKIWKRFEE